MCLTRENLRAEWVLYEAGALGKFVSSGAVCPYLLDLEFQDLSGPLAQFQARKADSQSTFDLIEAINSRAEIPVEAEPLRELFEALWPKLEARLSDVPPASGKKEAGRSTKSVLEDLVEHIRSSEYNLQIAVEIIQKALQEISHELEESNKRSMALELEIRRLAETKLRLVGRSSDSAELGSASRTGEAGRRGDSRDRVLGKNEIPCFSCLEAIPADSHVCPKCGTHVIEADRRGRE